MTVLHKPSINNNYKSSCWGSSFKIYFLFGKLSNVEACFLSLFIFLLLVFSDKAGGKYIFENQGDEKGGAQVNLFRAGETDFSLTLNTDTRSLGHSFNITNMFPCGLTFCSIVLAQKLVS